MLLKSNSMRCARECCCGLEQKSAEENQRGFAWDSSSDIWEAAWAEVLKPR